MGASINDPVFLLIDLFCGAGGVTEGAEKSGVCKVIAAVNHDPLAIESHKANHPHVLHMTEGIVVADLDPIRKCIDYWKERYPNALVILWASLECTNFSDAKGGMARDADSRSLADAMPRYLKGLPIDIFKVENVEEFMSWGPMKPKVVKEKGMHFCPLHYKDGVPGPHWIPESRTAGKDYVRWVKSIQALGYEHDWRLMNAANYGGVTIRERYFAGFWKPGVKFSWPKPTHSKKITETGLFTNTLKPWRGVKEVLDFSDLGVSIFNRKKPLVEKTLLRILAGLRKFHGQQQIMMCNSPGYCSPVSNPIGALTTVNSKAVITPWVYQYNGQSIGRSLDEPCATLTLESKLYLATPMLAPYYGTGTCSSVECPCPTVPTKDRFAMVTPWIDRAFRSGRYQSVTDPAGALLTVPKMSLCSAFLVPSSFDNTPLSVDDPAPTILASRKHINIASSFIVNPQYRSNGSSVNAPCPTVIAKQKSYPLSLAMTSGGGKPQWTILDTDSEAMKGIKLFMRENGITDILMRMLKVVELKRIQGFPDDYILKGPLNEQKKFIGNSVVTDLVSSWLLAGSSKANTLQPAKHIP